MTANERIESLLNRYGQTISDLPKTYSESHQISAVNAAMNFRNSYREEATTLDEYINRTFFIGGDLADYICHLVDVIDRMELALENCDKHYECSCRSIEVE